MKRASLGPICAGAGAGAVNGLLGAGGGTILIPALEKWTSVREEELFPTSVAIMAPICLVSLGVYGLRYGLPWQEAMPYLWGSLLGGTAAGLWGNKIPTAVLHRILGVLLLWGGIRSLC